MRPLRDLVQRGLARLPAGGRMIAVYDKLDRGLRHSAGLRSPESFRVRTHNLTIALTARCNLRCVGCRYGRDFMLEKELPLELVRGVVEDAASLGIRTLRLYGGEPLLYRDLPRVIECARSHNLDAYVTTNALLLDKRIDELYAAGLRQLTIGFYGSGARYDAYTQTRGSFDAVRRSIDRVRERYGDSIQLRLNWLLSRPTRDLEALEEALDHARRWNAPIQIDLIHYSLPYFTEGPDRYLQFRPEDRPFVERIVARTLEVKREEPHLIQHSPEGLRSIPDWLIKGPDMKVPCTKHEMLWIGADGTVQLCYVTFRLGNLHQSRLRDLVYGPEHHEAGRGALALKCANCHCGYDERVRRHAPTRKLYQS
ncbi:MAG: radical SAM protein [Planctomycetes bacterium]|nr:radical SAM protein [Planctomycetota bacterium]